MPTRSPAQKDRALKSTIAILNLVQDDLKQVEKIMREEPRLLGPGSFALAKGAETETPIPVLNAVIDHLMSSGGKRVRPALALLVNRIYTAKTEQSVALAALPGQADFGAVFGMFVFH